MLCITGLEKDLRSLMRRLKQNASYPLQEIRLDALDKPLAARSGFPVDARKIIVTCRRRKDHGLFKGPEEERIRRLEKACALGAGWVDVEADLPETSFRKIERAARATRTRILRSLHMGSGTGSHEIQGAFSILARSPGDAVKLCVPLDDTADIASLLQAPVDRPTVLVGTGPAGILTRALYNRLNSAWTYVAASSATAPIPGMLDVKTVELLGMPLNNNAPFYALLGGPSILRSPGFDVYNRLFRERNFEGCYLPAVTDRLDEAFELLCRLGLSGASVTIPHKVRATELVGELDKEARNARSVNTLYHKGGVWRGANTDIAAITVLAERLGSRSGQKALILGTGGFARAGAWALADMGINVVLLGRRLLEEPGPWEDCLPLTSLGEVPFHILFNATPVNGSDANGKSANGKKANGIICPKGVDLQGKIVIDGVLSPKATNLVKKARTAKSRIGTGADIWVEQGARQLELFGCPLASPEELKDLVQASRKVYLPKRTKGATRKKNTSGKS